METPDSNAPEEIQLRIQALADNELPEEEIAPVLEAIQGSYEYREQYAELLKLKRKLAGVAVSDPGSDWVARAERRIGRRLFRGTGTLLFVISYLALLGVGVVALFREAEIPLYVAILVGIGLAGLLSLLAGAIADRVRERKTDKYRGVLR